MNSNTYNLDITPGGVPLVIHISQYDKGLRQYTFQPFTSVGEFEYVAGATATLEATKPDGYAVVQNCTYNSDGTIDYTVQDQLTAKAGKVWSKIVLRNGSDVIGTAAVVWIVDKAGVTDDAIISDSDISGIRSLIESEVKDAIVAVLPTNSASGALASFSDGADNVPVEDLKISIEPVQSGSGDPSPDNVRPISGLTAANVARTGKNLVQWPAVINTTYRGVSFSIVDGKLKMQGTATGNANPYITAMATDYEQMPFGPFPAGTYTMTAKGMVGQSSSDRIIMSGKYADGTEIFSNIRISSENYTIPDGTGREYTFTATAPFKFGPYIQVVTGTIIDCAVELQMEVGTSVGDWEQYKGHTYPISFGSAGTVYGGTLDVTSGKLVINRKSITVDGSQNVLASSNNRFYIRISDAKTINATNQTTDTSVICDKGRTVSWAGLGNNSLVGTNFCCAPVYGNGIAFRWNSITTAADWKTYFTNNTTQFSYEIDTHIIYTLTPTEVRTLLGSNNIFADTGDSTVEYKADTGKYIENRISAQQKLISGVETSYTATKNYSIGDYVIVADTLYKVTAAIASGATITPGTNCVATTVAEQLILLANA